MTHNCVPPRDISDQERRYLLKNRQVFSGGKDGHPAVMYHVAGGEDMLPPATLPCMKADLPASEQYRNQFDRKHLPAMFRTAVSQKKSNPGLMESEDMYHAMCGEVEGKRRLEIDRTGFKIDINEEPNYGPDWPLLQIERGAWTERPDCVSSQKLDVPLRWPANVPPPESRTTPARDPSQHFRSPNGLADWGGISSLNIWQAIPATARSPALKKNASAPNMIGIASTSYRPRSTSPSAGTRSPGLCKITTSAPAREQLQPTMPVPRPPEPGFADSTSRLDTTREKGLDATRERGIEFSQSQGIVGGRSAISPNTLRSARSGNYVQTNRGVWSAPNAVTLNSSVAESFA
jgi:hypothetical protein